MLAAMAVTQVWHSSALMSRTFFIKFWNAHELSDRPWAMADGQFVFGGIVWAAKRALHDGVVK